MAWTDERVEQLKQLWGEGLSASQIANRMGGVTRNAVIGKVHRLGLTGRATPAAPKPKMAQRTAEGSPARRAATLDHLYPGMDKLNVTSIGQSQCKWPIGDPASDEFHFCGQPSAGSKPYCAYHSQVAFQPSNQKRERKTRQVSLPTPLKATN